MAYARVVAELVADNQHCDAWFDTQNSGRFGAGRDWEAREAREELTGFTPDVWGQYGWEYAGEFEYLKHLGGIAPIRTGTLADMALTDWSVTSGKWRESSTAGLLKRKWLHYYDAEAGRYAAGEHGVIRSVNDYSPNLLFYIWRLAPAVNEGEPAVVNIRFVNDSGSVEYAIYLPTFGEQADYLKDLLGVTKHELTQPLLLGRPRVETDWTVIDEIDLSTSPRAGGDIGNDCKLQVLRVENDDGALLIGSTERDRVWTYVGAWTSQGGHKVERVEIGDGKIEVVVIGHTAMFHMTELAPPGSATLRPKAYFYLGSFYATGANYHIVAKRPAGTSITAAEETVGGGGSRPVLTFTCAGNDRPILYRVQEYRTPVRSAGVSSPGRTQGNNNFALLEASGELSEHWRGGRMTAQVEAKGTATLNDIEPNAKVGAYVNVHDGANYTLYDYTDPVSGYQYSTQFVGYVTPPERAKEGGRDYKVQGVLNADDLIEARLQKKVVDMQCSFGGNLSDPYDGWTAGGTFRHLLRCAGLADTQISVDSSVENLANPASTAGGAQRLKFRPDTTIPAALDTLADVHAIRWGVNQYGQAFLSPRWSYGGTPDYTLNESTTTIEDMATLIRSTRSVRDWRNLIRVMVGEGPDAVAKVLTDEDSWSDDSVANFVGDVWTAFYAYPDGRDVDAIATAIWDDMGRYSHVIGWEMVNCPWIMPDETVQVYASSIQSALNGSIFRVISKSWEVRADGRYHQRLEAVFVQS